MPSSRDESAVAALPTGTALLDHSEKLPLTQYEVGYEVGRVDGNVGDTLGNTVGFSGAFEGTVDGVPIGTEVFIFDTEENIINLKKR